MQKQIVNVARPFKTTQSRITDEELIIGFNTIRAWKVRILKSSWLKLIVDTFVETDLNITNLTNVLNIHLNF